MLLTNWNTVTCPTCLEKLEVRNKNFSRLVGASGALMESLVFSSLYLLHFELLAIVFWMVAFIPVGFIVAALAWIKFLKLKPRENV